MQTARERSFFLCSSVLTLFALCMPYALNAAELSFSPASGSFPADEEFSVKVMINPAAEESVNAADSGIVFDKEVLSVASLSKDGSVFSLWTAEPTFSNTAGTITLSGGTPKAFSNSGTVLTIKFKGKKAGSGKVSFSTGSVLAADGKGTNVYTKGGEATLTITEAASAAEEESAAVEDGAPPPEAPVVTSKTHPKPEEWYGTSTVEMSWKVPADVTSIRTLFSEKSDGTPNVLHNSSITSQVYANTKDGEHYFYVQFRNEVGWGETTKRKVLIDTVPPKEFDVALLDDGGVAKFSFLTEDELSGMGKYEVLFGETVIATIKAEDLVNGETLVPPQEGGEQKVTVRAYDKANNIREVVKNMTIPKVDKPQPKKAAAEEEESPPIWTLERILIILCALVIGALASWNVYQKKGVMQERSHILEEVAEIRDKNDKIFSAMREEFEQMVNDFNAQPQLTPQERDFLENIKEVLEVSEELIDSGMEELKKKIRNSAS